MAEEVSFSFLPLFFLCSVIAPRLSQCSCHTREAWWRQRRVYFIVLFLLIAFIYSAVLRSREDSLHRHVILHEWLAFYSASFQYPPKWCTYSAGMAGATWNCCHLIFAFCVHHTAMHRCYTDVTPVLHRCYTGVTPMLHRCYTGLKNV